MTVNKEVRYAIVIGINDYNHEPLQCCVNDAEGIKDVLIRRCRFLTENIADITSSSEKPLKEVYATMQGTGRV